MLHDNERIIPENLNVSGISNEDLMKAALAGMAMPNFGGGGDTINNNNTSTVSNDNTKKTYNFYGIRDISAARNQLLRTEGQGAF